MRRTQSISRSGFTLIETIVTVGLIGVIAAFVVPTVIQKAGAADPLKVQNDLNTVRTGIETFASDVKNGFPHQVSALTTRPTALVTRFLDSSAFSVNQVATWNGPYMAATISNAAHDSIATGFSGYVMNFIERYDATVDIPEHDPLGVVNPTFVATNTLFAAVQVNGLTLSQAKALNRIFDGDNDVLAADSSNHTGRIRWPHPTTPGFVARLYYMASPIT